MFEGLVRQLLLGYLGQYIKDIHKEQLKITLWREEVFLDNVELILEAFDYLQLPFALKEGRVGRLSIKIPWKKLGREPIIISLEDVLVCACQRNDEEWSMDAVERREFAGKKAKLAAAELAKLSRRVCNNQTGKSFVSFITAKILDGIQVSIRNVHVLYRDMLSDMANAEFGLKFTSLTVMKQDPTGVLSGKTRGNQVAKVVEVQGLEVYCSTLRETLYQVRTDDDESFKLAENAKNQGSKNMFILAPVDVSISLLVNRPGKLEKDTPEYSINVEITNLVMSLDDVQLQQILALYDFLSTCRLRERYGRYRPWTSPLSKRLAGWQVVWWHYAQQSVLSDVRKTLRRTSWKYLGERLTRRHKYVKLYKVKLDCLRQEQPLDDDVLWELEQIEKETDIDDILSYRSAAECEIEEFLEESSSSFGVDGGNIAAEKSQDDEYLSTKPRGWLNWLSHGMLGAGGNDDSSQFSGVVSDEVIKDIYEATKFHSVSSSSGDTAAADIYLSAMKFHIHQISATLRSTDSNCAVAELLFDGVSVECKLWEESAVVTSTINSAQIINPSNKQVILMIRRVLYEENCPELKQTSINIQVDISPENHESGLSMKVVLQAIEVTFDSDFFLHIREFYQLLKSFTFQQERVLLSLNGIDDDRARLLSKAEFILSSHKRVMWDAEFFNILISIPWENSNSDAYKMVLESKALSFRSKHDIGSFASDISFQPYLVRSCVNSSPTGDILMGFQLKDLYEHFEIKLADFEAKLLLPFYPHTLSILDKLGASVTLSSCIIPDELILKRFEVYITISSFLAHFSLSICDAVLGLISNLNMLNRTSDSGMVIAATSLHKHPDVGRASNVLCFSVVANMESASLLVDLENDKENSCILMVSLQGLDVWISIAEFPECWICTKALMIISYARKNKEEICTLCTAEIVFADHAPQSYDVGVKLAKEIENEESTNASKCLLLHYKASKNVDFIRHKYSIWFTNVDLHCYPSLIGLLIGFSEKLGNCGASHTVMAKPVGESKSSSLESGFEFERFGSSNYVETDSSEWEIIPVDRFPFVTINNTSSLLNLENSLIYPIPEWRKAFKLREEKCKSPRFSFRAGPEQLNFWAPKCIGADVLHTLRTADDTDLFVVDLNLINVRVHFHDSACTVGTVTVPTSKSAIAIYEGGFDILFSSEGLTVSSSWWTQILLDFLWGPSLSSLSPILNVRVKRQRNGSLGSLLELSFSVQHVSCILPAEYLAILIGYFSLANWKPDSEHMDTESNVAITFKFEVLDSNLFTPVENAAYQLLKLDIQQLYCTFIENCSSERILEDVPSECWVPIEKVVEKNHCLNIFGRDLSLSLLFLNSDAFESLNFNLCTERSTLIAPLSADIWIRIPHEHMPSCVGSSPPICVMARVHDCELIAKGIHVVVGSQALLDIVNQFSSVDAESQRFTSDVLQFLQLKKSLKETEELSAESSSIPLTEIRVVVSSVSLKLYSLGSESNADALVAKAQMQFICAASLRIDEPHYLDISFSSTSLFSLFTSAMLVECTSLCPSLSIIKMDISSAELGDIKVCVSFPSIDIWLYLFDWVQVIDLCTEQMTDTSTADASIKKSIKGLIDQTETEEEVYLLKDPRQPQSISSNFTLQNVKPDSVFLQLQSENISMTFHIPVRVGGEAFGVFGSQVHEDFSCGILEGDQYGFIAVALESRSSELAINGKTTSVKCIIEKINGTVELCKEISTQVHPFFKFSQVNLEVETCNQVDHVQLKVEVRCDCLDVWLSHYVFYFWRFMMLEIPSSGSSQSAIIKADLMINLRKLSLLLLDGKLCSNGPLVEVLMRNSLLCAKFDVNKIEASIAGDLQVNYNNIHKVLWEPFVESWMFKLSLNRWDEKSGLLNSAVMTDIHLAATSQLNLNITESLIEVFFRAIDMIADAWGLAGLSESSRFSKYQISENLYNGRYAPYVLQNMTSLPLAFHVCEGPISCDDLDVSAFEDETVLQPGCSIPIYIDETPEEQLYRYRPTHSSERLSDKQFMETAHRYVIIRLEGTFIPSTPISMDLVGRRCFEVDFSKSSKDLEVDNTTDDLKPNRNNKTVADSGYVLPVIVDVSVQRYTKLIRLYSTVVLLNATSTPFEVRFDIPFGVSPKMLDPIYPGQEFPLPLHLAETGRLRWRPLGNAHLWSEAYNISNILSHENGIGFLRSVVCYPSHPSSDPFRFCISVHDMCLPVFDRSNAAASGYSISSMKQSAESCLQVINGIDESKKRFLHLVTLSSPLVVNNYLPVAVTLAIESGGVTRTALLSEVQTSFFHIDSSHDLALVFSMHEYGPSTLKFPRAETFGSMAKFSGTKFSLSESIVFDSLLSEGHLYITVEKIMDAVSGAREICISVPFLLYNCTGFSLVVSNCVNDMKGWGCTVPSCYNLEEDLVSGGNDGLALLSSSQHLHRVSADAGPGNSSLTNHIISTRKLIRSQSSKFLHKSLNLSAATSTLCGSSHKIELNGEKSSASNSTNSGSSSRSNLKSPRFGGIDHKKVYSCMYSPNPNSSSSDIMVQLSLSQFESSTKTTQNCVWSSPFFLVPSTGSTSVLVPQPSRKSGYVVSVTSSAVAGPISGRTRIITFQPRYVISNACSKDLYYKQKGTDFVFHLQIGQHAQIHCADIGRELLVSVRFDEPAWQWSGCFLPEHLGDTQLKMRNYVSGAVNMIRVEVQNADVSIKDEKIVGSSSGNSGTNLILLSDDDTGFMPYRVDNFSKERLRIYQQRCETSETIIHAYTSCPYSWDEPCFPHRLTVEVPGERVLGSYALDDVKEYAPVFLSATSEKPGRTLLVYVQAEGAVKVLSVVDSSCHNLNDSKSPRATRSKDKRKQDIQREMVAHYNEKISLSIPFIGISVMNSYPQELLYASAMNTTIDFIRSMEQETFSVQMLSLQIDNQLHSTPYPVILSFEHENRINPVGQMKSRDVNSKVISESDVLSADGVCDPVFTLSAAKWRNTDASLVSFEYISLRVADFHLELEQEVILGFFDFFKTIYSRFDGSNLPDRVPTLRLSSDFGLIEMSSANGHTRELVKENGDQFYSSNLTRLMDSHMSSSLLPSVVPIGAPWQQIYLLARKQKKIYVELFDLAPINLTLSFSSSPWMLRNGVLTSGESVIHRGLMALADIEGAQIHLKQLIIVHQLASWESIQVILIRHYTRQLLHEMYKVFGSAGVIGNPMGFARRLGLGVREFLSVPARSVVKNPAGLITGMAQGTTSLLSNTVYAISDAATQFSRAAHKGIVAFTFDDHSVAEMEKQQFGISSNSKGVINEFLEGLTGLLQSPIRGAEKHGLPGLLSGMARGVTGLVARPAASILEVTGKTAQSIRNRSKLYHMGLNRFRVRLPRPLSREFPLRPYSWEEAVGTSVLSQADDGSKLKDEVLVICKTLKEGGKFVIITERLVLIVSCFSLVDLGTPRFRGIPADPQWLIEAEIGMDSVIHADADMEVVHIVGSNSDALSRQNQQQQKRSGATMGRWWNNSSAPIPLFQTDLEFTCKEEAENFLQVLLSSIRKGKERGWGHVYLLHQSNLK